MSASRSAVEFMQRSGIINESRQPAPRLAPGDLLINFVPTEQTDLDPGVLSQRQGDPAPDRVETLPWPSTVDES